MLLLPHMLDCLVGMITVRATQIPRRRRSAPTHARRATTIATRLVIFLDEFALYGMRLLLCARAGAPLRVLLTESAASGLKPPASGCQLRLIAGSARLFVLLQPERQHDVDAAGQDREPTDHPDERQ